MKKTLSTIVFILMLAGLVWGAQLVIDTVGVYTTPQAMMQAIDDNFDELYLKWTNLGATHDTSGELDALYEAELDNLAGLADALSDAGAYMPTILAATNEANFKSIVNLEAGTDFLSELSQDATPQLGGDLDLNGHDITGVGVLSPDGILPQVLDDAEYSDTDDTTYVLTAAEVSGNILTNKGESADTVFTFPALAGIQGSTGMFIVEAAYQVNLDPNGTEQFYYNGNQMAAGENIVNSSDTVGDMISWVCTETACYFKSDNTNWDEATPP